MYNNENLPERYLRTHFFPYNVFLKEINNFNYSNSEKLGDVFEYLLSFVCRSI